MNIKYYLLSVMIIISGCRTNYEFQRKYSFFQEVLNRRGACTQNYDKRCISIAEMTNTIGFPDERCKTQDIPQVLSKNIKYHFDISGIMEELYRYYSVLYLKKEFVDDYDWNLSEDFKNLDVWLYLYDDSPKATMCGHLPDIPDVYYVLCFITDKDKILFADTFYKYK